MGVFESVSLMEGEELHCISCVLVDRFFGDNGDDAGTAAKERDPVAV